MKTILADFCARYDVPAEGAADLQKNLAILQQSPAWPAFAALLADYENDPAFVWNDALVKVDALAEKAGVHTYVLQFLYSVLLLPAAKRLWLAKGLTEELFWASMRDLAIKLEECRKMHGIWGTFVASWFRRWFDGTRVWLGRLQFETVPASDVCSEAQTICGHTIRPQDYLINIHIPSGGHMPHDAVVDAYRRATAFFAPDGPGAVLPNTDKICYTAPGAPIFCCHSWLLWPEGEKFLPRHSNVLAFLRDFHIVEAEETNGSSLWRTFYVPYTGDPTALPENGSFNKAYKQWLLDGGKVGNGLGLIFWDAAKGLPIAPEKQN